jgi:hypothetical protein
MRLMEVGTKAQGMGKMKDAEVFFGKAYDLYSLFWGLQMNVINPETVSDFSAGISIENEGTETEKSGSIEKDATTTDLLKAVPKKGFMGKLGELVRKAVDCCIE